MVKSDKKRILKPRGSTYLLNGFPSGSSFNKILDPPLMSYGSVVGRHPILDPNDNRKLKLSKKR